MTTNDTQDDNKTAETKEVVGMGNGYEASKGALEIAADAANTLWWWDNSSDNNNAERSKEGVWRTRTHVIHPKTGIAAETTKSDDDKNTATEWVPWKTLLDNSEAPYFRWFVNAKTNACFNAVDRHLLEGRGSDVALTCLPEEEEEKAYSLNRRELAGAVAIAALELRDTFGLKARDRVLFHMPTDAMHFVYMLACQRLGVIYSATAVDSVEDVLISRAADLQNLLTIVRDQPVQHGGVRIDCFGKIENAMPAMPMLVVESWAAFYAKHNIGELFSNVSDEEAYLAIQKMIPALPCESDHPLFVSYTSGSTGKPKGIVHGHGGYTSGVLASMHKVFNTKAGEGCDGNGGGILTVGSSGWITGQSYMFMGPLLAAVRSVMMVGSPVYPSPLRMIETVASERCTILKTGSAVVRQLMTDTANAAKLDALDTSCLRCATFCAEPVSMEVHKYGHKHITNNFINSYWATEHGSMVLSRDVSRGAAGEVEVKPDTRTWPLPWVSVALDPESSDVVITSPYPSLALTIFGHPEHLNEPNWRGDLEKYCKTYWPPNGGGFVQGDVARSAGEGDDRGFTFHGRSDEVINVNGNRVGTEQIERCLWGLEVGEAASDEADEKKSEGSYAVKDCCVVGAPDFVKGTTPVAFVVFKGSDSAGPDLTAFKSLAAMAVTSTLGAYAIPDHIFAVDMLPKTITNKTARKTLQLLLAGHDAPSGNLAKKDVLPPIAKAVKDWRIIGAMMASEIDLTRYWDKYTFSEHNVLGQVILPGAGWLTLLCSELGTQRLSNVSFMKGVHESDVELRMVKRRRVVHATVGDDVVFKLNTESELANPANVGPKVFRDSEVVMANDSSAEDPEITEDSTAAQHYRRCKGIGLNYSGAYRAVKGVEWHNHIFRADVESTHLPAILDAGLQVVCTAVRANTFIPVGVGNFHLLEGADSGFEGIKCVVHGEILEQHQDSIIADLRYERQSTSGLKAFSAMERVRFARVDGKKPRLQPKSLGKRSNNGGLQTQDPKETLSQLRQLTEEKRLDAISTVVRDVISDLTDTEVDFEKTAFENGMHSLNAVELLSRINNMLGTVITTKLIAPDAKMSEFVKAVSDHVTADEANKEGTSKLPFPNVDYEGLNKLFHRRLAGKKVGQIPRLFAFAYIARLFFKQVARLFRSGMFKFFLFPPKQVGDLSAELVQKRRVKFKDLDLNQHFTVAQIIDRSVDGVEQIMSNSGLVHVEMYYGRNLFAAKINATFHKELGFYQPYEIRSKITKIRGSLIDIRIAFVDANEHLCFEVLWTVLIVLDSKESTLLDWENIDLMEGKWLAAGPHHGS